MGVEEKLCGAVLTGRDPRDFEVKPMHFASPRCKQVWREMLKLAEQIDWKGKHWISPMVLVDHLGEETLGATWQQLDEWSAFTESPELAEFWADRVLEEHSKRCLNRAVDQVAKEAEAEGDVSEKRLKELQAQIDKRQLEKTAKESYSNREAVDAGWSVIEAAAENLGDEVTGISSGIDKLDEITGGWQDTDLIILAARPSMGKTALALGMLLHTALKQEKFVALYSLEMSVRHLMVRLMSTLSGIPGQKIKSGRMNEGEFKSLMDCAETLRVSPYVIVDRTEQSIVAIRAHARRHKPDLVIVDYLQLVTGTRTESRQIEVASVSRGLKALANELGVPVIALSQINRKLDDRKEKRPNLSDLRESGAIEQDADVVVFVHRDDYYRPKREPMDNLADLIVAKQRNGPTGEAKARWINARSCFANYTPPKEEP